MNKTTLGKVLVLTNLALSLIFASWALALYTNRVDFSRGGTGGAPKGEMAKREEQYKLAKENVEKAQVRYAAAGDQVRRLEAKRKPLQDWYEDQYRVLETGMTAQGQAAPIRQLTYRQGQLVLDDNDRPVLQDIPWTRVQPLVDLQQLRQEYDRTHEEILKEKEVLEALNAQLKDLTEQLNGDGKQRKGLRAEMADVQRALLNCLGHQEMLRRLQAAGVFLVEGITPGKDFIGEHEYLMPLLYNRLAEQRILEARHKQLTERLKEASAAGTATAGRR